MHRETTMDPKIVAAGHADYLASMMPMFLGHKSPERIAEAIDWTRRYCETVLPDILIGRNDPIVKREE